MAEEKETWSLAEPSKATTSETKETWSLAKTPPPAKTVAQSVSRGALQGASLGFGDEIAAAIDYGVSKLPGVRSLAQKAQPDNLPALDNPELTYQQRRDAYRKENAQAKNDNPAAYTGGQVGGAVATSLIPAAAAARAGLAAKAAPTIASAALGGGALGGANAVGNSEKSDFMGELGDALKGALAGAATAGVLQGVAPMIPKAAQYAAEKLSHASPFAALYSLAHGHPGQAVAAAAAPIAQKLTDKGAALLTQALTAAKAGNSAAQRFIATLAATPEGAAKIASLAEQGLTQ